MINFLNMRITELWCRLKFGGSQVDCQYCYIEFPANLIFFFYGTPFKTKITYVHCNLSVKCSAVVQVYVICDWLMYILCIYGVSFPVQEGYNPLCVASQEGHMKVVDTLLKNGVHPDLACTV